MSNSRGNGEALQLNAVYKKPYCYYKSPENLLVLQVTQESVSGTASHVHCVWTCNEAKGSYVEIIITIVPSYTGKKYHSLSLPTAKIFSRTRNNTDSNKLVIFSGTAFFTMVILIHRDSQHCCTCLLSNLRVRVAVSKFDTWTTSKMIPKIPLNTRLVHWSQFNTT